MTDHERLAALREAVGKISMQSLIEGQKVLVSGGVAEYRNGVFYTGMDEPKWTRPIQWTVDWWLPIHEGEAIVALRNSAEWLIGLAERRLDQAEPKPRAESDSARSYVKDLYQRLLDREYVAEYLKAILADDPDGKHGTLLLAVNDILKSGRLEAKAEALNETMRWLDRIKALPVIPPQLDDIQRYLYKERCMYLDEAARLREADRG